MVIAHVTDSTSYVQKAGKWEVGRKENREPGEGLLFS